MTEKILFKTKQIKNIFLIGITLLFVNCNNEESLKYKPEFHMTSSDNWINNLISFKGESFYDNQVFYQELRDEKKQWKRGYLYVKKDSLKEFGYAKIGDTLDAKEGGTVFEKMGDRRQDVLHSFYSSSKKGILLSLSEDNGETWSQPLTIIQNTNTLCYKDPKIRPRWGTSKDGKSWDMVVVENDHFAFFTSEDLRTWKRISTLKIKEKTAFEEYRYPDLINAVLGWGRKKRHVITYSYKNSKTKEAGVKYIIGELKEGVFTRYDQKPKFFIEGPEHYGGVGYGKYYRGVITNPFTASKG